MQYKHVSSNFLTNVVTDSLFGNVFSHFYTSRKFLTLLWVVGVTYYCVGTEEHIMILLFVSPTIISGLKQILSHTITPVYRTA